MCKPPSILGLLLTYLIEGDFVTLFQVATALVVGLTFHEYAHALAADLQGDRTARLAGRLTLDPRAHLDPMGAVMLVLLGFGWGKPVPFNPGALRSRRFGAALVGAAGPGMNLALGTAAGLLMRFAPEGGSAFAFLQTFFFFQVLLAVFNLIPLPPLDGSRIVSALLPPRNQGYVYFMDRWGWLLLFAIVLFPVTRQLLFSGVNAVFVAMRTVISG